MFRHGDYSTEIDKKPFIFTLTAFLGSMTAAILIIVLAWGSALALFAGFLVLIVGVASGVVLFAMVTDRAYIDGDTLFMRYLFKKKSVPVKDIGSISYKDEVYSVFDKKGNILGTVNGKLTGIGTVILELDKRGVTFV
ncbi:MAG: hypothetical protein IKR59_04940 [Lachnospiraceae bacterium]|nr:hypothetical protein [Lachnospiraceae bacterium]